MTEEQTARMHDLLIRQVELKQESTRIRDRISELKEQGEELRVEIEEATQDVLLHASRMQPENRRVHYVVEMPDGTNAVCRVYYSHEVKSGCRRGSVDIEDVTILRGGE